MPIIRPAPSADWRTKDLQALWRRTRPWPLASHIEPLHRFLQYSALLRTVCKQFEHDNLGFSFDRCVFFLRGGYFIFSYLNVATSLPSLPVILGGLNHGRRPGRELRRLITELRDDAIFSRRDTVRLIIADEVRSGAGINRMMRLVKHTMHGWAKSLQCRVEISLYAIRTEARMTAELKTT